jgi:alkylation response protein AidB-like acyl-CoA dehydrogenase
MNLAYGPDIEAFRGEVRQFIKVRWSPEQMAQNPVSYLRAFRADATKAGYLYRAVPRLYGGSEQPPDMLKAQVIREEFGRARAPSEVAGNGTTMVIPTLLQHGTDWQKQHFLPPTVLGDFIWAQGYSEPNAGSDLASLRTKGELVGDHWVINGQKIWTSHAQNSHYMFALVRTEPDRPKHSGISYLLIDLHQPGVTIRPLRQMTGRSEFCEVFLDDVRTPADWIVGERGQGWTISRTTLKHERSTIGGSERNDETFLKLVSLAKRRTRHGAPAIADKQIRQKLVELEGWIMAQKASSYRRMSLALEARDEGLVGLVNKQLTTEIAQRVAALAQELIAESALTDPIPARGMKRGDEKWLDQIMGSLAVAIAGGASNIQRNIIGERGLGLPRDLEAQERGA